jgi:hypothetical protein
MGTVLRWEKSDTRALDGDGVGNREAWVIRLNGQTVARVQRGEHWTYRAAYAKRQGCTRLHWAPLVPALRSFAEAQRWVRANLPKAILRELANTTPRPRGISLRTLDGIEVLEKALAGA